MSKEFYIVRHGLTEKPGVLLGQHDVALSGEGRRQASELARQLAAETAAETPAKTIERIVSSQLRRARETAAVLAESCGLSVETDARLNEISYGCWDGLTWDAIERLDPATAQRKSADWWSATPAGGETALEFFRRVQQAWTALLAHPANITMIVAHEAVNAMLAELVRNAEASEDIEWEPDWKRISSFRQPPGTLCKLSVRK